MGYIILIIFIILCIVGNIEIEQKGYPKKILYFSNSLMIFQIYSCIRISLEGSIEYNGAIYKGISPEMFYYMGIFYYLGFFVLGVISVVSLLIWINFYDKVAMKNLKNEENDEK